MQRLATVLTFACLILAAGTLRAEHELLAFPGAEGYGAFAKGGRSGDVYIVANLKDSTSHCAEWMGEAGV